MAADATTRVEAVISGRDELTATLNLTVANTQAAGKKVVEVNRQIDASASKTRQSIMSVKQAIPSLIQGLVVAENTASGWMQAAAGAAMIFGGAIGAVGGLVALLISKLRAANDETKSLAKTVSEFEKAMAEREERLRRERIPVGGPGVPPGFGTRIPDLDPVEAARRAAVSKRLRDEPFFGETRRALERDAEGISKFIDLIKARAGTLKEMFAGVDEAAAASVKEAGAAVRKFWRESVDTVRDAAADKRKAVYEFNLWYADMLKGLSAEETAFREFQLEGERAYWKEREQITADAWEAYAEEQEAFEEKWLEALDNLRPNLRASFRQTFTEIRAEMTDNLRLAADIVRGFQGALRSGFDSLFDSIVAGSFRAGEALRNLGLLILRSLLGNISSQASLGVTSLFGSLFGGPRAGGGPVEAGRAYVVGEQRPELFIPNRSGRIAPSTGGGGSQGVTIAATFHAVDAASFAALAARNPEAITGAVLRVLASQPMIARAFRGTLA